MPNLIYVNPETQITWKSSGGTAAFTPTSLASGAGRQGAMHDLGATAAARRFAWRAWIKPGGTRTVGEIVEVYLKTAQDSSGAAQADNDDGTSDIAVSARDKLRNLRLIGVIQIDENAAVEMVASGVVEILHQHVCPVFWNATSNALSSTAGDFGFSLTPVPDEVQ